MTYIPGGGGGGGGNVATLGDVAFNNPQTSDGLVFDGSLGKWRNAPLATDALYSQNNTNFARRGRMGLQVHANPGQDATANHFDAHRSLESSLGVSFDQFSYYMTLNSTSNYVGASEYTAAVAPLLQADPARSVLIVLENFCARPGNGNLHATVQAIASPTDQFTLNVEALSAAIVAAGHQDRVAIALMHECNGSTSYPWQIYNTPGEANANSIVLYKQAYRGIVDTMRSRGVTAQFVQWFLPSNSGGATDDFADQYVGDAYADKIGLSYYNRVGLASSGYQYWEPVGKSLREPMRMIERMSSRPVWICESSCAVETTDTSKSWYGKSKAVWFADLLTLLNSGEFPRIECLTLFLVDLTATETGRNWTLQNEEQRQAVATGMKNLFRSTARSVHDSAATWNRNILPIAVEYPSTTRSWSTTGASLALDSLQPSELDQNSGSIKVTKLATTAGTSTSVSLRYTLADTSFYIPGEGYVLSFWARSDVPQFLVSAGIRQSSGSVTFLGDEDIALTNGWKHYTVQIASGTATSGSWRVPFFGIGRNESAGSAWFTGIRFSRGLRPTAPVDTLLKKRVSTPVFNPTVSPLIDTTDILKVTLTGNITLENPIGAPTDGQELDVYLTQDATGGRTATLGSDYRVSPEVPFTVSASPLGLTYAKFSYDASTNTWRLIQLLRPQGSTHPSNHIIESSQYRASIGMYTTLKRGVRSTAIQLVSDSTGIGVDGWLTALGMNIQRRFPEYSLVRRPWSSGNNYFYEPSYLITGTGNGGGERGLQLSGGVFSADTTAQITGDLEIVVKVGLNVWASGTTQVLVSDWYAGTGVDSRSWMFSVNASGNLALSTSPDGIATATPPLVSSAPVPFNNGQAGWLKVSFDADTSPSITGRSATFATSSDGRNWTQLGTIITASSPATLYANIQPVLLGARSVNGAYADKAAGTFYWVEVRNEINGPTLVPPMLEEWEQENDQSFSSWVGAPMILLVEGAIGGENLAYFSAQPNAKHLLSPHGASLLIINDSQNEGDVQRRKWITQYSAFVTQMKTALPGIPIVCTSQNPLKDAISQPSRNIRLSRHAQLATWTASQAGVYFLDPYEAFDLQNLDTQINADNIHPTRFVSIDDNTGCAVWGRYMYSHLIPQ